MEFLHCSKAKVDFRNAATYVITASRLRGADAPRIVTGSLDQGFTGRTA
jgi:hypothetical protein